jgi:DNA-binding FadR family transcriptional regulator
MPRRAPGQEWSGVSIIEGEPVRVPKVSVMVAAQLRRSIIRGDFKPGDPLPNESGLMELYDVSRPVVREALRIIESESLISVKRGAKGGARVKRPDIAVAARHTALLMQLEGATVADLFEARLTLEPDAVRRLAEQRPPEAMRRLRELHDRELTLVENVTGYPIHAAHFHEGLIELAGNKTLAVLGRLLLQIIEVQNRETFSRLVTTDAVETARGAAASHGKLIELIEAGKANAAVALWRQHLEEAAEVALERLGPTTIVDLLDHDVSAVG